MGLFSALAPPIERNLPRVAGQLTRILSDLHFGDRASRVDRLPQLRPLLAGVTQLVLNGDTLDTRPGPFPTHTAECRAAALAFFAGEIATTTYLTGNHDPDFSPVHHLTLAGGAVFVTHGDILFDDIVPWGRDAPLMRQLIAAEFAHAPVERRHELDYRLAVFRRVAAAIPQRHQSERNPVKYAFRFLTDTVWPPQRVFCILRAWREAPARAAALARRHRPAAKFIVNGHTHRPGVWQREGVTVINSGSYCPPLGGTCVDLAEGRLTVRRVEFRQGAFHPGATLAEFPLAAG